MAGPRAERAGERPAGGADPRVRAGGCARPTGRDVRVVQASSAELFGNPNRRRRTRRRAIRPDLAVWRGEGVRASPRRRVPAARALRVELPSCTTTSRPGDPRRSSRARSRRRRHASRPAEQDTLQLGTLDVRRDWGWAPDYARALELAGEADAPDDFVIATGATHSIADFVRLAFARVGHPRLGRPGRARPVVPASGRPVGAGRRLRPGPAAALGWAPTVGFAEIVERDGRRRPRDRPDRRTQGAMTDARGPAVLLDATPIPGDRGGVGRYVDELVPALLRAGVDLTVVCRPATSSVRRCGRPHDRGAGHRPAVSRGGCCGSSSGCRGVARRARRRRDPLGALHVPPVSTRRRRTVSVHDLTFFSHPELHSRVKVHVLPHVDPADEALRCGGRHAEPGHRRRVRAETGADRRDVFVARLGFDADRFHRPTAARGRRLPRGTRLRARHLDRLPRNARAAQERARAHRRATGRSPRTARMPRRSSSPAGPAGTTRSTRPSTVRRGGRDVRRLGYLRSRPTLRVPRRRPRSSPTRASERASACRSSRPWRPAPACSRRGARPPRGRRRRGRVHGHDRPGHHRCARRAARRPRPSCGASSPRGGARRIVHLGRVRRTHIAAYARAAGADGRRRGRGDRHPFLRRPPRRRLASIPTASATPTHTSSSTTRPRIPASVTSSPASPMFASSSRAATSATAEPSTSPHRALPDGIAVDPRDQPRHRLRAGIDRRAARRRRVGPLDRIRRSPDPERRRNRLPLGTGTPVAANGHRACAVLAGLALEPVDGQVPAQRGLHERGGDPCPGGLAQRGGGPRAQVGIRADRRVRPALLHVLRGRGPRQDPRRGGLGEHLRARPRASSTRAASPPSGTHASCSPCTTGAPISTSRRSTGSGTSGRCGWRCGPGSSSARTSPAEGPGHGFRRNEKYLWPK